LNFPLTYSKFIFFTLFNLMFSLIVHAENTIGLKTQLINTMIENEAAQIESSLKSIEENKTLKENLFTQKQLEAVTILAKKFINCTKKPYRIDNCSALRQQMNLIGESGEMLNITKTQENNIFNGPGDILSSIGDSYQVFHDPSSMISEYNEILNSISKENHRGLPTLIKFSNFKMEVMRKTLNQQVYPLIETINSRFSTPNETLSSEQKWSEMTACEDAVGYSRIDRDATDNAKRCEYSDLDERGLIRNKEFALKYNTPCVKSQSQRGTCTSFATVGALEIRLLKNKGIEYNLSEQYTYLYNEIFGGWWGRYQYGVSTMNALKKVKKYKLPIPLEKYWVYNPSKRIEPYDSTTQSHPLSCVDYTGQMCTDFSFQANEKKSNVLRYIYTAPAMSKPHISINSRYSFWNMFNPKGSLDSAVNYLNQGEPIIVSFTVKANFKKRPNNSNYVRYEDLKGGGGHAAVLVGFIKNGDLPKEVQQATEKGYFILRNSWGSNWADCGHIYVDYKYFRKYAYGLARITYKYHK
jgi:C1A family cysteine protease